MADFASMMIGGAQQSSQQQGAGLAQSLQAGTELGLQSQQLDQQKLYQGAQLAIQQQDLQLRQQQMQQQMQSLQNAKSEKMMAMYESGNKLDPKAQKIFFGSGGFFRNARDNMGMSDQIPDSGLDTLVATPEGVAKGYGAINAYRANGGDPTAVWSQISNPLQQAEMSPYYEDMNKQLTEATKEQNELKKSKMEVQATTNRQNITLGHQDEVTAAKELSDFGDKLANPTTRSMFGKLKSTIDSADAIKQLTDTGLPANATPAQRIAAYDKLDSRQVAEVVKSLDRQLSQSNPTVHGQEALAPPTTPEQLAAKYGEKVLNGPVGASQGAFIDRMMGTVNRERDLAAAKYTKGVQALKDTKPFAAKRYGDTMDKLIQDAATNPLPASSGGGAPVNVGGVQMSPAQAAQFYKENPQFAPAPGAAQ